MEEFREVSDEKAKKFADTNDFLFSKISAKTNTGLNELFVSINFESNNLKLFNSIFLIIQF
jgi:hypothetical protein